MTICIGWMAPDGVVLASDSQSATFRGIMIKRLNENKIVVLDPNGDVWAALATAGRVAYINKAIRYLKGQWRDTEFRTVEDVEGAVEEAVLELGRRYDRASQGSSAHEHAPPKPAGKPRATGMRPPGQVPSPFFLLAAVDTRGDKLLAHVGPDAIADTTDTYVATGSGSPFAEYILSHLYVDDLPLAEAVECAIYVIEEVKNVDLDSGGAVNVATVTRSGVQVVAPDKVQASVQRLAERGREIRGTWQALVLGRDPVEARKDSSGGDEATPVRRERPVRS